jgi:multidrug efflux pump subunit AcrA (membrane-fusion protein)
MFARGEFEIGASEVMALPQSAVQLREGFSYVFQVAPDSKVRETKITVGRRAGDRVEVTAGLAPDARVVVSGGGFLADGDTVRVVPAPASTPAAVPAAASGSAVQVARP